METFKDRNTTLGDNTGLFFTRIRGNVTASGEISSSGLISAANFHVPGQGRISFDNTDTDDQFIKGLDNSIIIDSDDLLRLRADHRIDFEDSSNNAQVSIDGNYGHITASGEISSSDFITGKEVFIGPGDTARLRYNDPNLEILQGGLKVIGGPVTATQITASANISASGTITSMYREYVNDTFVNESSGDIITIGTGPAGVTGDIVAGRVYCMDSSQFWYRWRNW